MGPAWQSESTDAAQYLAEFQAVWSTDITEPMDPFTRTQPVAQMNVSGGSSKTHDKRELPVAGRVLL